MIGWDAADWRIIRPLMDEGKMPNLKALLSHGSSGNLATLNPPLSPMLWSSIATGKRPFKHGIHGFTEPDPSTGFIRPISSRSRTVKAFWNILSQEDLRVNVVGWWPSHPAESINGVMVSNQFHNATKPLKEAWPVLPGAVHPQEKEAPLAELRVHPAELSGAALLPFIPSAKGKNLEGDKRLESLAKVTAECASIQAMATELIETTEWDCTAIYFDGIDHYGHGFMKFHPPKRPHINDEDFELYQNVMTAAYQFHDSMLGVLVAKAGPGTTVMLLSDHGFHPDDRRPLSIPAVPAGPAAEHRSQGIFAMAGPGVKVGEPVYGAGLLDICPTLLHFFGLPVARDMDGRPLQQIFTDSTEPKVIDSWEAVEGEGGMHGEEARLSPEDAKAALQQLVDLGYIEAPDANQEEAVNRTVRELNYNLACSYLDAYRYANALSIFENLYRDDPDEYRFGLKYISCLTAMGCADDALETVNTVLERKRANMKKARVELKDWNERVKAKEIDPKKLNRSESFKIRRLRAEATVSDATVTLLRATLLQAKGQDEQALKNLEAVKPQGLIGLPVQLQAAAIYTKLKRYEEAEERLLKALAIDDENASVRLALAHNYLAWRHNFNAAAEALKATELSYFNPRAHYLLGTALGRLGQIEPALNALKLAISQNPNYPEAHRRLAFLYEKRLKKHEQAAEHRELARLARKRINTHKRKRGFVDSAEALGRERRQQPDKLEAPFAWWSTPPPAERRNAEDFITIVSGLPRSGTSMMMQILEAAGLRAMTDAARSADDNNPKGYFEYEPVKQLGQGPAKWLDAARGRSIKIIAQLLARLPKSHPYRIIFMTRDLNEIVQSQRSMLDRLGREGAALASDRMRALLEGQLVQVSRMLEERSIPLLLLPHQDCLNEPGRVAEDLSVFLGFPVDEKQVAGTVDPNLYRSHS